MFPWQINPTVSRDLVDPVSPARSQKGSDLALPDAPAVPDSAGRRRTLQQWMAAVLAGARRRSDARVGAAACTAC